MSADVDVQAAWDRATAGAAAIPDASVDALWRTLNYLCAAQIYLRRNVLLESPLSPEDVKETPGGHWGVCPPVNVVLAALAPVMRAASPDLRCTVVHGAGHAGPAALAYAYLAGTLETLWPRFRRSRRGLERLIEEFPHPGSVGGEISAAIPGHAYMGGQLGPALPFACGFVLDQPQRLAVPLVGDGECETGTAAAAWLGARALRSTGAHGRVLPVVLVNGQRMGGPSLLSSLEARALADYFRGLGYAPVVCDGSDVRELRVSLYEAVRTARPPGEPGAPVFVLTLPKGATGPVAAGSAQILHAPRVHKAPLHDPRRNATEFAVLSDWLASYRCGELLTDDGRPTALVAGSLPERPPQLAAAKAPTRASKPTRPVVSRDGSFGDVVADIVRRAAAAERFRLFSPDELASNRISLARDGPVPDWVTEILSEELCHAWLQGYLESGGAGVFVSYEAFAGINSCVVDQYLKHLALKRAAGLTVSSSMNYVLTSLGWNNTYSHQNPAFVAALLAREDPATRVFVPADARRVGAALESMLATRGRLNVLVASKHTMPAYDGRTVDDELRQGAAVWPSCSDDGEPDLVLAAAGDVAAQQVVAALPAIRADARAARLRVVGVGELTALGDPSVLPHALDTSAFEEIFGAVAPVLLATTGFPAAVRGLAAARPGVADRLTVLGYRDPRAHISGRELLRHCGLDAATVASVASQLLRLRRVLRRPLEHAEYPRAVDA